MKENDYVNYLDFGAIGDGVADDFAAICAAHDYANEHGLSIRVDDGRTYLIRQNIVDGVLKSAIIKTDVIWGSSKIVIDDTDIDYFDELDSSRAPIFKIGSDYDSVEITDKVTLGKLGQIGEGTTKLNVSFGYPALLVIYNDNHRVYRRYGDSYGNQSSPQNEVILIDAEGNIDSSTPFMFDYKEITRVTVIRADVKPIVIKGGMITTLACQKNPIDENTGTRAKYVHRNILINRSNVTLEGVEHYVCGEVSLESYSKSGLAGAHYWGFFNASFANNVTLKDCVLTGRRSYRFSNYEFHADHVNLIRLFGCKQSNFTLFDEDGNEVFSMSHSPLTKWPRCWGIGGTNFCKNMEYVDCRLSRFDAHQGLYNGKIINSEINFMEIIGKGELLLEGVKWYSPAPGRIYNCFAYLRDDFGCTWQGTITFKNCTFNVSEGDAYVFFYRYADWDFGYQCHFPSLLLDNPTINGLTDGAKLYVVRDEMKNVGQIVPPSFVKIVNNKKRYNFLLPKSDFFEKTEKVGVIEK